MAFKKQYIVYKNNILHTFRTHYSVIMEGHFEKNMQSIKTSTHTKREYIDRIKLIAK